MSRDNEILPGVKDGQQGFDRFEDDDDQDECENEEEE